jgi:hypothetical protein
MMTGWTMLFYKEVLRFWKVGFQTVAAPVLTAVMYLMIFGHVLEEHVQVYDGVSYTAFLIPGLVMMSVLQNAFANSVLVAHAFVALELVLRLCVVGHGAWRGGGLWRVAGGGFVCVAIVGTQFFAVATRARMGVGVCLQRRMHVGQLGLDRRFVGGQI